MPFTSLADRISTLPLLLAGPILRHVESTGVTVWVALKENLKVWLEVYEDTGPPLSPVLKKVLEGNRNPIRIGDHLFVVAVTATGGAAGSALVQGKNYYYNLFFTNINATSVSPGDRSLLSVNDITSFEVHYADLPEDLGHHDEHVHLPSLCLPPGELSKLRIVHGSCRKAHAEGLDAMPGLDKMIMQDSSPEKRPHYLLLTGDQFYADDVSPIMLYLLMDAEVSLLGKVEDLPTLEQLPELPDEDGNEAFFFAGERKDVGGFTSHESNHLATAGEYMCYYLFMWSDTLWLQMGDDEFPAFKTIGGRERAYNEDLDSLRKFRSTLPAVRRAMANIPTYMIFDDHDVTDDWYMTFDWCLNVLGDELGRRMVMNALMAYAIFQDWGNKPVDYQLQQPAVKGTRLLELVEQWFATGSRRTDQFIDRATSEEPEIQKLVGIPVGDILITIFDDQEQPGYYVLRQDPAAIDWYYNIQGNEYEIRFLDGRTRRAYPDPDGGDGQDHPNIISNLSMANQIGQDGQQLKELTIIIAPTPIVSIPAVELREFPLIARKIAESKFEEDKYEFDVFDHWKNQSPAAETFFSILAKRNAAPVTDPLFKKQSRVLIITGDVHFSAVSRMQYEFPENKTLITQVVSSSFKKQEFKTRLLHQLGYKFGNLAAMEVGDLFMGIAAKKLRDMLEGIDHPAVRIIAGLVSVIPFFVLFVFHMMIRILSALLKVVGFLFMQDWYNEKGAESRHFLGWTDPITKEGLTKLLIPVVTADPNDHKFEEITLTKPFVVNKSVLNEVSGSNLKFPDWQYRIDFILADNDVRRPADDPDPIPPLVDAPGPGDRKQALGKYLALASNHYDYTRKFGNGKEIVGVNNISEIFFDWSGSDKKVKQESWWRLVAKNGQMLSLFPLSKFRSSMNFDDPAYPIPPIPVHP